MNYLLGIDLGTTAIKVGLFSTNGEERAICTREYEMITPSTSIVEQNVEVYWQSLRTGVFEVLKKSEVHPQQILALSISAQSETLIVVDRHGAPLRNAIVWMDTRAKQEADALKVLFSREQINHVTGQTDMLPIWPAAKILWLKNNEPNVYRSAYKYLLIEDYFLYRMCGRYVGEGSLWSSSLLWDITKKRAWPEMLQVLGIEEGQLPEITESGVCVGPLRPEIAEELGLSAHTQVVTGGLDGALGAIGVGNVVPGIFSESTGAAMTACLVVREPFFDPHLEMPCFYSPIANSYLITAFTSGGVSYRWLRDQLCQEELSIERRSDMSAYEIMDREAASVSPGCEGLTILPHFQGAGMPDTDSYAKCTIQGLTLRHTKAHIIRGVLEGVSMALVRMVASVSYTHLTLPTTSRV